MHRLQEARTFLSDEDLVLAAEITELSPAAVLSVTSFYTMFRLQPMEVRYGGGFAQAYTLDAEGFRQAVWSVDS